MINRYFLLIFLFLSAINTNAKNNPSQLLNNIPSEGLSFLFYYDANRLLEQEYLKDVFSSDFKEIFEISKEAVVFVQDVDAYCGLTIRFKLNEGVDFNKIHEVIESSKLQVSSTKGNFIYLKEEQNSQFGYVMKGEEYLIVKIFYNKGIIDKKYSEQSYEVYQEFRLNKITYDEYSTVRDSLHALDEVNIVPYFNKLIANDEKVISEQKVFKKQAQIPSDLSGSPFILHFNEKTFFSLITIIGYDNSVFDFILKPKSNDFFEILEQFQKFHLYETSWIGCDFEKNKLSIVSVTSSKEEPKKVGIDMDLVQYMPEQVSSFICYGADLGMFRDKIMDHINYDVDRTLSEMKLGFLMLDDDFLNFFQSGMIAFDMEPNSLDQEFILKAAFKMPNEKKGKQLLKLLSEFDYIQKVDESQEDYLITYSGLNDTTYLVIEGNVWIFGTQTPRQLRKKSKKMLKKNPELSGSKTTLVAKLQGDIMGRDIGIGEIYSKSDFLDKKTIRNIITVEINKEIL
ncbi:hypothetical protein [Flammeovirga sp. SJP92]|uniref:hypothetical protein n=1 Tax=Flammeovirga sp. SJP92 TaxID=1775430 RepID=UPI0007890FFF|nr:hypothetical protein [Flammeovirga sp. SJP92]KXX72390.1 hypothetical protein AVL50_01965 [Flammeovirga sp. SJP92]